MTTKAQGTKAWSSKRQALGMAGPNAGPVGRRPAVFVAAVLALLTLSGCNDPQLQPANQQLSASLRTALSARNSEWLEQNATLIAERHQSGEMSEEEFQALQSIVQQAREGQWAEAEQAVVELQRAQRPTASQREALERSRTGDP